MLDICICITLLSYYHYAIAMYDRYNMYAYYLITMHYNVTKLIYYFISTALTPNTTLPSPNTQPYY